MFTFASVVRRTLGGGGGAPTEKKKRGTPGKPVYKQYGPGLKYMVFDGLGPTFKHIPAVKAEAASSAASCLLNIKEDRYGGVEVFVREEGAAAAAATTEQYVGALNKGIAEWRSNGKQGVWLKVPTSSAAAVP
eukprot:gene26527-25483_t